MNDLNCNKRNQDPSSASVTRTTTTTPTQE